MAAIHKIFFGPSRYNSPDCWHTYCGETFWQSYHGTTEGKNVTCKRCKNTDLFLLTSKQRSAYVNLTKEKKKELAADLAVRGALGIE